MEKKEATYMELERQRLRDARVKAWRNSRLNLMTVTDRDLHFPSYLNALEREQPTLLEQKTCVQFTFYTKELATSTNSCPGPETSAF